MNMGNTIPLSEKVKSLAWRIRSSREDMHWNQEELAKRSGVSRSYISNIESGRIANVTVDVAFALADALGVSRGYLIGLTEDPLGGIPDTEESEETKPPTPTVGGELLTVYQQLTPQQQSTLLSIAKVLKAADEPKIVGME